MKSTLCRPLFAWDLLEHSVTLKATRDILEAIPDAALLESLNQARGKGRDDFSVRSLWGALLLSIVLRSESINACLEELARNPALALLVDIECESKVPGPDNMSRFLATLGEEPHLSLLRDVFDRMAQRLGRVVGDLGAHVAGDSTGLRSRAARSETLVAEEKAQGLPQPSGGRKEYVDDDGQVTKVVEWFGFKLHLLVDAKHEVALAYHVTDTKAGDNQRIVPLLEQAQANLPTGRIETLTYDKAADDRKVHADLHELGIKPIIRNRTYDSPEPELALPAGANGRRPLNVVYDQAGTVYCYDCVSEPPVRHPMSYIGHEAARETLKYRCPARHEGWNCPSEERCNAGRSYGLTVRVDQTIDLRRFPSVPRATKQFERLYAGRTSVERVNGRLKIFWGIDDGQVYGSRRFHAHVGAVMVVHLAFATLLASMERSDGGAGKTYGKMRLTPIAEALRAEIASSRSASSRSGAAPSAPPVASPPASPT